MASKSTPDVWGIGQLLPNVSIHRLDQRPGVRGILSDLTCDSDGKINKFISDESSWPLHELEEGGGISGGGRYYLGMFLGGAYEEALGGVHNLFGGPSVVRVLQSDGPRSFAVTRAVPGPSCGDVLRVMQHEPELMFEMLKHRAEEFVHDDGGSFAYASLANGLAGAPSTTCLTLSPVRPAATLPPTVAIPTTIAAMKTMAPLAILPQLGRTSNGPTAVLETGLRISAG
ncbi:arginine decarboxylase 1B, chloroplastic-like [Diospyros lotus]|uniref:arginine decarboxylase 1B, chloroplastic-like n=1 Tax=Diospyros lotus TaxID=55363 RepID=UPI0022590F36|nr:arginine decarboxylase 1B, chloroplastic-like [Diospyros lotus]